MTLGAINLLTGEVETDVRSVEQIERLEVIADQMYGGISHVSAKRALASGLPYLARGGMQFEQFLGCLIAIAAHRVRDRSDLARLRRGWVQHVG